MIYWKAKCFGVLDVSHLSGIFEQDPELLVVPCIPGHPLGLSGEVASLWRQLAKRPVPEASLSIEQRTLVREFADYGMATRTSALDGTSTRVQKPWLSSPMHELVYSLIGKVAEELSTNVIFIKGPVLAAQGLRSREHSGDVDVWADPRFITRLSRTLSEWGWNVQPEIWDGTIVNHSVTLEPTLWGCEIDIHRRFPGSTLPDEDEFLAVYGSAVATTFAGTQVWVPDIPTHRVIQALHLTRPDYGISTPQGRIQQAAQILSDGGSATVRAVSSLGASTVLSPALELAFPGTKFQMERSAPLNWTWQGTRSRLRGYFIALRMVPASHRPIVIWRMLWPTKEVVELSSRLAGDPPSRLIVARWRRFRRGLAGVFRKPCVRKQHLHNE